MRNLSTLIMVCGAVISLCGCETILDPQRDKNEVQVRYDNGNLITPLPPKLKVDDTPNLPRYDTSVDVMDFENHSSSYNPAHSEYNVVNNIAPPVPQAQAGGGYGAGVPTGDPSVTIFPLEGEMPNYGSSPNFAQNNFNSNNFEVSNTSSVMSGGVEGQIFFRHGSSRLGRGDINKLSNVAAQAKFAPVNRITVEGYASQPTQVGNQSVEGHILNLKESMNRSFAVSKKLMQEGVPAEKIKTVSWGATKASGSESQDRRVDITMGER